MSKKKKPCIRNLPAFRKGCPESDKCPCWIEKTFMSTSGQPETHKMCLDLWMYKIGIDQCKKLEGTQEAVESFRNNTHEAASQLVAAAKARSITAGLNENRNTDIPGPAAQIDG